MPRLAVYFVPDQRIEGREVGIAFWLQVNFRDHRALAIGQRGFIDLPAANHKEFRLIGASRKRLRDASDPFCAGW